MALRRIEVREYEEVLAAVGAWWRVSREGARRILRVGNGMLEATLAGEDPRERWPKRYAQESVADDLWKRTPTGGTRRLP